MGKKFMSLVDRVVTAEVAAGVEAGDVKMAPAKIKAKGGDSKDYEAPFTSFEALTVAGAMLLTGGKVVQAEQVEGEENDKEWGFLDHFNYSIDLALRQSARQKLLASIEGPAKLIEQTAQKLVQSGLHESLDEARAEVIEKRKAKGLPV